MGCGTATELVLEQQGSCRAERGAGWNSREAAGHRAVAGTGDGLQRRGSALVCLVWTVHSKADIDAWWNFGRPDLGLNLGFDHVNHDT